MICVKVKVRSDNRFCRECLFISQVGRRQVFALALHCKGYFASCDRQDCTCTSMSVSVGLTWTTCAWLTMHSLPRWNELEINVMVFIDILRHSNWRLSALFVFAEMWGLLGNVVHISWPENGKLKHELRQWRNPMRGRVNLVGRCVWPDASHVFRFWNQSWVLMTNLN